MSAIQADDGDYLQHGPPTRFIVRSADGPEEAMTADGIPLLYEKYEVISLTARLILGSEDTWEVIAEYRKVEG